MRTPPLEPCRREQHDIIGMIFDLFQYFPRRHLGLVTCIQGLGTLREAFSRCLSRLSPRTQQKLIEVRDQWEIYSVRERDESIEWMPLITPIGIASIRSNNREGNSSLSLIPIGFFFPFFTLNLWFDERTIDEGELWEGCGWHIQRAQSNKICRKKDKLQCSTTQTGELLNYYSMVNTHRTGVKVRSWRLYLHCPSLQIWPTAYVNGVFFDRSYPMAQKICENTDYC